MLKKVVSSVDFDGNERQDILYFNLTEPEIVRLDVQFPGGLEEYINNFDQEERPEDILSLFEKVIRASYGEKSDDGRYFVKKEEITDLFFDSSAYSALFVELISDADVAANFVKALLSRTTVGE